MSMMAVCKMKAIMREERLFPLCAPVHTLKDLFGCRFAAPLRRVGNDGYPSAFE